MAKTKKTVKTNRRPKSQHSTTLKQRQSAFEAACHSFAESQLNLGRRKRLMRQMAKVPKTTINESNTPKS